jgi:CBS domain containing-hemolysin-like protein
MDLTTTILLASFFLLAEGFFSGSEYLLISFSKVRLRSLAESGEKSAAILEELLKKPERIFGTTSIGTNLCVLAGSALVTAYIAGTVGVDEADLYSFLIMGPVTLIFGEITPKIIFRQRAEGLAPYLASPLARTQKLFSPILFITSMATRLLVKIFIRGGGRSASMVTREELLLLTKQSDVKLDLAQDERQMIHRIFEFKTSAIDTAMQPLVNIMAVSSNATIREAKAQVAESGYSRLPVFFERAYNIVGVVSAFDILRQEDQSKSVETIMQPAFYTPVTRKNPTLLKEMNEKNIHMAVVVDEYGGSVGIVTVEDLLEEIVGEIEDEYDATVKLYEKVGKGRFIVDAMMEVDSVNELLGFSLPTGDYETVSGLIIDAIERIPKKRTRLALGKYLITVTDATQRRATSVEIVDTEVSNLEEKSESESD